MHKGIEIRATLNGEPIMLADSYRLHWAAKWGHAGPGPGDLWPQLPDHADGWGHLLGLPILVEGGAAFELHYRSVEIAESADEEADAECESDEKISGEGTAGGGVKPEDLPYDGLKAIADAINGLTRHLRG